MSDHVGSWVPLLGDLHGRTVHAPVPLRQKDSRSLIEGGARLVSTGPADIVVLVGGVLDATKLIAAARPGGRVAVLVANTASPLARLDAWRGAATAGVPAGRPAALLALAAAPLVQVHGLLRSAAEPVTAMDVSCPIATRAVLAASRAHVHGGRAIGLRLLAVLAGRSSLVRALPALLITASWSAEGTTVDRITGMIGNRDSEEIKIVRGEPPSELEKHYARVRQADAESRALIELAGQDLAPRLLARSGPRRVRMSWAAGVPATLSRNPRVALRTITRVAAALRAVQETTARPDGTVLVHGDFWPGNVLLHDDGSTVIDWTDARRGSPRIDRDFLLGVLARDRPALAAHAARLLDV